jgi:hypothetical protein
MKHRFLAWLLLTVVAASIGVAAWSWRGPQASDLADLRDPRLTRLSDRRMLVIEAAGDPNVVGAQAFSALFRAYYRLEGVSRFGSPPAPRARWPQPVPAAKSEWHGQYALPVPEPAVLNSADAAGGELVAAIRTWSYGDVVEVLHIGPYSAEDRDIQRLKEFAAAHGYRIIGDHEEEYVRGPGMIFRGDPDKYLTIIRLRVETFEDDE